MVNLEGLRGRERILAMQANQREVMEAAAAAALALGPQQVTPYQARVAINNAGLRASVEAAVAAADQNVKDAWEYATVIERQSPFIIAMGAALGLSEAQINGLFLEASQVE